MEPIVGGDEEPMAVVNPYEDDFDMEDDLPLDDLGVGAPTKAQKQAVLRLHQNTGYRAPLRLAKALAIAGAAPELIKAAKEIRCDTCLEHRRPASHRPASLPKPWNFGDQVHVDLVAVKDLHGETIWVMHGVDVPGGSDHGSKVCRRGCEVLANFVDSHFGSPKSGGGGLWPRVYL